MMRGMLMAWTLLAALVALAEGIWISPQHPVVGVVMLLSALLLLGLVTTLIQEQARRTRRLQPAPVPVYAGHAGPADRRATPNRRRRAA